jgi:hypothetical protein
MFVSRPWETKLTRARQVKRQRQRAEAHAEACQADRQLPLEDWLEAPEVAAPPPQARAMVDPQTQRRADRRERRSWAYARAGGGEVPPVAIALLYTPPMARGVQVLGPFASLDAARHRAAVSRNRDGRVRLEPALFIRVDRLQSFDDGSYAEANRRKDHAATKTARRRAKLRANMEAIANEHENAVLARARRANEPLAGIAGGLGQDDPPQWETAGLTY